jgi:Mg2+/citrate symporter
MSLRERLAWIAVSCTLVIWGYYFTSFWLDVASLRLDGSQVLTRFIVCMVVSLAVMIGLSIVTGVMSRKNLESDPDELERQIEGKADRIGFRFVEWLVPATLIPCLLLTGRIAEAFPADPAGATGIIFANAVLMVVVVTELIRETVHIVSFRMTA